MARANKYTTRAGDDWATIARKYGLDASNLIQANKSIYELRPGTVINLPVPEEPPININWGEVLSGIGRTVKDIAGSPKQLFGNILGYEPISWKNLLWSDKISLGKYGYYSVPKPYEPFVAPYDTSRRMGIPGFPPTKEVIPEYKAITGYGTPITFGKDRKLDRIIYAVYDPKLKEWGGRLAQLARSRGISVQQMYQDLINAGYIKRDNYLYLPAEKDRPFYENMVSELGASERIEKMRADPNWWEFNERSFANKDTRSIARYDNYGNKISENTGLDRTTYSTAIHKGRTTSFMG